MVKIVDERVQYLRNLIEWNHEDLLDKKFFNVKGNQTIEKCLEWIQESNYRNYRLFPMFLILCTQYRLDPTQYVVADANMTAVHNWDSNGF